MMEEIDRLRRELEIRKQNEARWLPCPDCRDKVPTGECQVCRAQRAEAKLAAQPVFSPRDADELVRLMRIYLPAGPLAQMLGDSARSKPADRSAALRHLFGALREAALRASGGAQM